jgi:hypothetical protein
VTADMPAWKARLRQVVLELIACLYISGKRSEEEKEHSDLRQVVSEHRKKLLCFL